MRRGFEGRINIFYVACSGDEAKQKTKPFNDSAGCRGGDEVVEMLRQQIVEWKYPQSTHHIDKEKCEDKGNDGFTDVFISHWEYHRIGTGILLSLFWFIYFAGLLL